MAFSITEKEAASQPPDHADCGLVNRMDFLADRKPKALKDGQYSDPVYKKLSLINGEINKMTKDDLRGKLGELGLDTRGMKDVLKKRLKNYYKRKKLMKARILPSGGRKTPYDYILVIDFEATCEYEVEDYRHEIIEFPAILIDVQQNIVVDEFHSYCRPNLNSKLTKFCSELTGISQTTVEISEPFPDVLSRMEGWMKSHGLGEQRTFAVATDGPWDMSRFLHGQCIISGLPFPRWARKWVNVRKTYSNFYQVRRAKICTMLENLGLTFEGRLHCGLHDARNIARICMHMNEDGCIVHENEELRSYHHNVSHELCYEVLAVSEKDDMGRNDAQRNKGTSLPAEKSTSAELVSTFKELNIKSGDLTPTCDDDDQHDDQDNVDDLIEYYKLQKS